jgi:hypothetical protein
MLKKLKRTCMSLHSGVGIVIKHHQQARHNFVVELLFKSWRKVSGHLADGVARSVPHSRMLKIKIESDKREDN